MPEFNTRKIVSGVVLLITGLAVVYIKGDIPPNLLSLMQVMYSAFVVGNAFEHYSNMKIATAEPSSEKADK